MFKWPGSPSPRAPGHELADFAELDSWRSTNVSRAALIRHLVRLEENDYSQGVPEEDEEEAVVEDAYTEIDRRMGACRGGYPFVMDEAGHTLRTDRDHSSHKYIIYKYLLLATRLNMSHNRLHAELDGTQIFEKLAAEVAREYLGARSDSLVFGTAGEADEFPRKVDELCGRIKEGEGYTNRDDTPRRQQDAKLDVVAWKHFSDGLPGKLIAFGQCKTGTSYRDTLTQLQPDSFCNKWLRSPPMLIPVRMFFVSEALPVSDLRNLSRDAGLLFDRCRIVDFCDEIDSRVLDEVVAWTGAAAKATGLPVV